MLTPFGKLLRNIRYGNGELLKNMADKLGISSSQLSSIETGRIGITDDLRLKFSELYGISEEQMMNSRTVINPKGNIKIATNLPENENIAIMAQRYGDLVEIEIVKLDKGENDEPIQHTPDRPYPERIYKGKVLVYE